MGEESGASRRGIHYYDDFRECPRKFYYKRVLGLEPDEKKPALVKGLAMHAAQETFLREGEHAVQWAIDEVFKEGAGAFYEDSEREEARAAIGEAYASWRLKYGDLDAKNLEVVSIEGTYSREILPGKMLTGRIDRLMRDTLTGGLIIFDTKTSSAAGPAKIALNTELDDQLPLYSWLVQEAHGEHPTCVVDAVGFYKKAQWERSEIYYDQSAIDDAVICMQSTIIDLEDRLAHKDDWRFAFPRHTLKCRLWGCPYADFCRTGCNRGDPMPGFEWVDPNYDEKEEEP